MFGLFNAGGLAAAAIAVGFIGAAPSNAGELTAPSSFFTGTLALNTGIPSSSATDASDDLIAIAAEQSAMQAPASITGSAPIAKADPVAAKVPLPAPVAVLAKKRATLAQLVSEHRSTATPNRERECLAGAIYFESKGEPLSGQVAVGQVVANRAKSGRFPGSYCGVVFQRSQFSFIRNHAMPVIARASANWKTAVAVAHIVANGLYDAVAPKSLFFHARRVSPNWKRLSKVATVGNHIFYR